MLFSKKKTIKTVKDIQSDEGLIATIKYLNKYISKNKHEKTPDEIVKEVLKNDAELKSDIKYGVISKRVVLKNFNRFVKAVENDPKLLNEFQHGSAYMAYCIQKNEFYRENNAISLL